MNRLAPFVWLAALTAAGCATTEQAPPPPAAVPTPVAAPPPAAPTAALPPLLDRELLFGDPEIAGGQLSPDGRFLTVIKPYRGVMNVWLVPVGQPVSAAKPMTADTARPIQIYSFSQDGRFLLYLQDKGGDENHHIYAVDPTAAAEAATGAPPARDLTPYPKVHASIIARPEKTPGRILVSLNDRDVRMFDVYWVDIRTGKRELVQKNTENVVYWTTDLEGKEILGGRLTPDGGTEILRARPKNKLDVVYSCTYEESCEIVRFHKDGKRVYLETNKGEDLTRLVLLDIASKKEELVESDPEKEVDFGTADFSDATEEIVATHYEGDRLRTYPRDPAFAKDWQTVRKALPDGDLYFGSSSEDDRLHVLTITSDVDPGATYLYDRGSGKVELLFRPRPKLPSNHLAAMKPVRIKARDGVLVPAYLTLPRGVEPRNLPAVINPHGGPWSRDSWEYDAYVQLLANRGYAVLQPNFRGSTGYGKRFLNLGNKQWGTGSMQHDLSDCARWLAEQGIADPKRIAIMGISYGGFATLAGVAFTPDLYAAGVDIVGPSSILTLFETVPPYWSSWKKRLFVRVGDPGKPDEAAQLREQSPLYSATKIKSPLLVIQGANDPRVKKTEADQIVGALRDLGRPVEYIVAADEGHGFAGGVNRQAMIAAVERFLAKHLGGRAQTSMTPDVGAKLASITVDPKTVVIPAALKTAK